MKGEARGPPPPDPFKLPPLLRCGLVLLLGLCGCLVSSEPCMTLKKYNKTMPPNRYLYLAWKQEELPIKLDTSERLSHQLATALTKILLQEGCGYQNVVITQYSTTDLDHNVILNRLKSPPEKDPVPESMVNMEVWIPPTASDIRIEPESDMGKHSSGGRFSWFVSKNSSTRPGLITDHWRSFRSDEVVKIFSLNQQEERNLRELYTVNTSYQGTEEGGKRRYWCEEEYCSEGVFTPPLCQNRTCATLFVGNHSSYNIHLKEQVEKERLLIKVAWVGPNLTPQFVCVFRGARPIMFFDWWPNSLSNLDGFTPVSFPSCYSSYSSSPYLCNYEMYALKKYIWKYLLKSAKPAVAAIRRFQLSERDYRELIGNYTAETQDCSKNTTALQELPNHSQLVEKVACDWLRSNGRSVWYEWLPVPHDAKTVLWIGGIFPMNNESSAGYSSRPLVNAAQFAYQRINMNESILKDYELEVINLDGGCKRETVLTAFMHHIRKEPGDMDFEQMVGILGPACSNTVEPLVGVAKDFKTVVMSYSAEGAIFDYSKYPHFFRTIPENKIYGKVYKKLFELLKWKQVGAVTEDSNKYSEYLSDLVNDVTDRLKVANIKMKPSDNVVERLQKLNTHKIIIGDFYEQKAREVLCQAYYLNMTAKYGYVWFLPRWLDSDWYNKSVQNSDKKTDKEKREVKEIPCTREQMLEAIDRHMSLGFAFYAPDDRVIYEGITVAQWREEYKRNNNNNDPPDYAGYTYDAVWAYSLALDKLLKEDRIHASNFHTARTLKRFSEIISKISFSGVSGMIHLRQNSSGLNSNVSDTQVVNIMQFVVNPKTKRGSYSIVGTFNPQESKLNLNSKDLQFFHGIPGDGLIEDKCLFETFSNLLGVECDKAIIIVMVLIFVVFAFIFIAIFIVYKRRYEKMIPDSTWRLEYMFNDEWELPREKVVINRTIGEGEFGTVYGGECQFSDNSAWLAVAVKTLKVGSTVAQKLDFLGEAEMMKRFNHRNIVQLLGLCTHQEPIYMVMEFMLYGDLKTYLLARRHLVSDRAVNAEEDEINSKRLTSMALDVCMALAYLAEHRYVHRDVACRNCLVSAERVVKLSDFGMTRAMHDNDYYRFNRKGMLPVRWMSPESLEDGIFTNSSDMWSYGVLLYEIITFGSFPFQGMSNNQVLEHVRGGKTITLPSSVRPQLEMLLMSCWSMDPEQRPTFTEMAETLTTWPRLITPCLELPTAAIQLNDTDSVDIALTSDQQCRRSSAPNTRLPTARPRLPTDTTTAADNNCTNNNAVVSNCIPLRPIPSTILNSFPSWHQNASQPQENGSGPSHEPLLPQDKAEHQVPKYVCLQRSKSGENNELNSPPSSVTAV